MDFKTNFLITKKELIRVLDVNKDLSYKLRVSMATIKELEIKLKNSDDAIEDLEEELLEFKSRAHDQAIKEYLEVH